MSKIPDKISTCRYDSNNVPVSPAHGLTDGQVVDLGDFLLLLWSKRWLLGIYMMVVVAVSGYFVNSLVDEYKAEVVLLPVQESAGGLDGLAAQYGGLAAIAGFDLSGTKGSDVDQAIAIMMGRPFLERFIKLYGAKPALMAAEYWDEDSGEVFYDDDVYDVDRDRWVVDAKTGVTLEPTEFAAYKKMVAAIEVDVEGRTGLITLSVTHLDPQQAVDWVVSIVAELNTLFQMRDVEEAERNVAFLQEKINETGVSEMRAVFYRMIEVQTRSLMLAQVKEEYLLKTLVAPRTPEEANGPNRLLIFLLLVIVMGAGAVFVVFTSYLFAKGQSHK